MEHPTAFNGMAVHGVPTITQERVILRMKCLGETSFLKLHVLE